MTIITFTKKYFINLNKLLKKVFKSKKGMLDDFRDNASLLKYVTRHVSIVNILEKYFILKDFESHKKDFYFISKSIAIDYKLLEKFEKHVEKSSLLTDLFNSNIVRWEFFNKEKNYNYRKLSTGEKQLLEFIVSFAYTIKTMNYTNKSVVFIEEIEISMHPEWQKKLLSIIISIFKKLDLLNHYSLKYNLIFTTHSPFLISDIPKQNILFLDKDKNGNCKVLSHDEALNKKQTFGANIHTLLSDSFFMEDGLMGEFAKGKINEVIKFLQNNEFEIKSLKEVKQLISIVGEPILQTQLSKLLMKYENNGKTQKEIIENKIKLLEKQLEEL